MDSYVSQKDENWFLRVCAIAFQLASTSKYFEVYSNIYFMTRSTRGVGCGVWVCGLSLVGIAGSNPAGAMDVSLL